MVGIYKITSPTNKIYIGQSIDIKKRLDKYRRIDFSVKGQTRLYRSLIKYGFENHKVEILEECFLIELNEKERHYQELYNAIGENGLNCLLTKTTDKKRVMSEESINKQRQKMFGKKGNLGNKHSEETKKIISNIHKGNKYNLGRKHSKETIEKRVRKTNKLIIDLNNGVYYNSPLEYANLNNINYNTLTCKLSGRLRNNTSLIYA